MQPSPTDPLHIQRQEKHALSRHFLEHELALAAMQAVPIGIALLIPLATLRQYANADPTMYSVWAYSYAGLIATIVSVLLVRVTYHMGRLRGALHVRRVVEVIAPLEDKYLGRAERERALCITVRASRYQYHLRRREWPELRYGMQVCLRTLGDTNVVVDVLTIVTACARAERAVRRRRWREAYHLLAIALRLRAAGEKNYQIDWGLVLARYGVAAMKLGREQEATAALRHSLDLGYADPSGEFNLARLAMERHDPRLALAAAEAALRREDDAPTPEPVSLAG